MRGGSATRAQHQAQTLLLLSWMLAHKLIASSERGRANADASTHALHCHSHSTRMIITRDAVRVFNGKDGPQATIFLKFDFALRATRQLQHSAEI